KEQAGALADRRSARAEAAGAANTLVFTADGIAADNTDGVGLLRDLTDRLHCPLAGRRLLLAGAGGAARGVLLPLLEARPAALVIANRNATRARALAAAFADHGPVSGCGYPDLAGHFDLVINATSASLAYDMAYGKGMTPFLATARAAGARIADGLGMLVEQAAASFVLWRGVQPDTAPVYAQLRRDVPAP
ncbi:MAG TPA: shikimate dehydrogenase, partial [Rhodocyclaceae bacterium]|nr:shikimate dehydrogenase [Rhodocyclaceae bacterium]